MTPEAHPGASAHGVTAAGDLVRIEYDLWSEGGGKTELLDTTHEEVAQKANAPKPEGRSWGPRPHEIGGDYFPTGIENALVGIPVGEEVEREFAPADAFGERDPNLIELFSMHEVERLPEMRREGAHLDLGTVLTIEGRRGRVVSMTAARVRVDFNPPFAGRKVRGTFQVLERIIDPVAKVRAVLELQYGRSAEFHVEHHEKTISLKLPERSKFDIAWMAAKPRVVDRLRTYLHPETIRIVEEYATPAAEKKEETAPSSAAAEKEAEPTAVESPSKTEGTKAPGVAKGASRAPAKAPAPAAKDA
jgi:FKBP-type peptidyl-prolyl cis-trans isomerase 2